MKKIFSFVALFMLSLSMIFSFVACDKKEKPSDDSGDLGDSALTTQQILKFTADKVDEKLNYGSGCFASKVGEIYNYFQYDENVYLGLNLLNEVSKISGIEDSKWYKSQVLDVQNDKVDKLLALKLSSSVEEDVVILNLIVKFSIKGLDVQTNTKSYNLYNFVIDYNKDTKDVSVDAVYEKSRDIENLEFGNYSVSNCFRFCYNNGILTTTQFKRNIDINDLENSALINNSSINDYNFLKFNLTDNNVIAEIVDFDVENALKASVVNSVKDIMITLESVNELTDNMSAEEIQVLVTLTKASDAENILQLA